MENVDQFDYLRMAVMNRWSEQQYVCNNFKYEEYIKKNSMDNAKDW